MALPSAMNFRGMSVHPFGFHASTFNYTDSQLLPFPGYSYSVLVSTNGSCCTSKPDAIIIPEAPLSGVSPPDLQAIGASQINVSWSPPSMQNGKMAKYLLRCDGQEYTAGQGLSFLVSNLQPFTQFSISLVACTAGGCTASGTASAWTMEAPPENMDPPVLQVTSSETRNPHDQIRSYERWRDGASVYSGLATCYHNFTLAPGVEYRYLVTATNSQGSVLSPLVKDQSSPSAPSGLQLPKLQTRDALEILEDWDSPVRTNSEIINYTLFIRELFERET